MKEILVESIPFAGEMLRMDGIMKHYENGKTVVLKNIALLLKKGETAAFCGISGCGKSTLLNILATLDSPDKGCYWFMGQTVFNEPNGQSRLSANFLKKLRYLTGFVFQTPFMLSNFSVAYNIGLPLLISGQPRQQRIKQIGTMLTRLGLEEIAHNLADELSGGQRQRVAIGRAIIHQPAVIFADEPTGNLDTATATEVINLLFDQVVQTNTALVLVTHNPKHAIRCQRIFHLRKGSLNELTGSDRSIRTIETLLEQDYEREKKSTKEKSE